MPRSASFLVELLLDFGDQQLVAVGERIEPRRHHLVGFRIEFAERQIVELLAHRMHAHAAGERRIDFQRLLGGAPARLGRHVVERAHIVQAVGELDQQHAHVVGDRQQKLAQIFRLLCFLGDQIELLELGQPFDQRADVVSEQAVDLGAGGRGILNGVMQQRRGDRRVVELEVGENGRHLDRVGEIGIAGGAPLLAMRLHGVDVGAIEQRFVGVGIVAAHPLDQVVLPHHRRLSRLRRLFNCLRGAATAGCERRPGRGLLLHARKIGARARHICCLGESAAGRNYRQDITSFRRGSQGFAELVDKSDGPALRAGPLTKSAKTAGDLLGVLFRQLLPAAPGLRDP